MEHSINREQGFLIYLPINSDVKLNLQKSSLWFSFFRPSNMISGISLKSRIRAIARGRPLRTMEQSFTDIAVYEGDPSLKVNQFIALHHRRSIWLKQMLFLKFPQPSKLVTYEIEDLGLITGVSHPLDILSHLKLMFHMEPSINTLWVLIENLFILL